jgi:hypothetical protein
VRQPGGLGVSNLTAANFSLSEPSPMTVTGQSLCVMADRQLSYGSDFDLIQNTLRAYFNNYYPRRW